MTIKLNDRVEKPTRKQAVEILERMLQVAQNRHAKEWLRDYADDLEALYKFTAPPIKKIADAIEDYLPRFVANSDDKRKGLWYIHVTDGLASAANGHVAVQVRCNLDDGYYDPTTMQPVQDVTWQYPDFAQIKPEDSALSDEIILDLNEVSVEVNTTSNFTVRRIKIGEFKYNYDYMLLIANGLPKLSIRAGLNKVTPAVCRMVDSEFQPELILLSSVLEE